MSRRQRNKLSLAQKRSLVAISPISPSSSSSSSSSFLLLLQKQQNILNFLPVLRKKIINFFYGRFFCKELLCKLRDFSASEKKLKNLLLHQILPLLPLLLLLFLFWCLLCVDHFTFLVTIFFCSGVVFEGFGGTTITTTTPIFSLFFFFFFL